MNCETSNPSAEYIIGIKSVTALNQTDLKDAMGVTSYGTYIYVTSNSTNQRRVMA